MGAVCELPTANSPDGQKDGRPSKQRTLRITKKELPIPLVNTVQGFVRTELKAKPLNTDLVVPREVMDLILFFYALQPEWWSRMKAITWAMVEQDPKKRTQFRIVDLVYAEQPDGSTEMALQCQIPTPKPRKKRGGNFNEQMLESMGKFYRGLSLSSKQKLWSNAVKVDQTAGTSKVLDATFNLNHIEQLLCDLVVQYMETMHPSKPALKSYVIKSHVAKLAEYIFLKYHPVKKNKFVNEEAYFVQMIDNYLSAKRSGIAMGGAGYRIRC